LKDFKALASLRHDRLSDTESSLPTIFWIVLITGSMVGLLFAMLLGTEKFWLHILMTSMLAIIIANAFYLIIELDYPFMGSLSAKPTSYIKMLETMGGR
jgi:ABC-type branched-subunit amino acid transport system permease subunit